MPFSVSDVVADCYHLGNWPGGGNIHLLSCPCVNYYHKGRDVTFVAPYHHLANYPSDSNRLLRHSWKTPSALLLYARNLHTLVNVILVYIADSSAGFMQSAMTEVY